jgi:hypothetical protein
MRRSSTGSRIRVVLLIALSSLILPAALTGCIEGTCEDNCLDQYDDCLARSPPGASKADCGAAYDSCLQYCSSVGDAPEQN